MKALVVYDSVFGNTEKVALAIGEALGSQDEVSTLRVGDVKQEQLSGLDLLIVGSPTRAFKATPATMKLLAAIPSGGLAGTKVAAFDTRISIEKTNSRVLSAMVRVFGYAAKPIANKLTKKGGDLALPPEGFFVEDSEGPLTDGELERAAAWAAQLVAK